MTVYRILSYIAIVLAGLLALVILPTFFVALANPALLLSVFMLVGVVLYSFSSFAFLLNGIDGQQPQPARRKDFIKVNAYVTLVFSFLNLAQAITIISNPGMLTELLNRATEVSGQAAEAKMLGLMKQLLRGLIWFLLLYGLLLLVHVQITFRLLKQYAHLFDGGSNRHDV
ncbi:MAG: hypothetical protein ACK4E8_10830 [Lacibacter sp.]|jgi:hypothetical protein